MQLAISVFITCLIVAAIFGGVIGFLSCVVSLARDKQFQRVKPNEVIVDKTELENCVKQAKRKRLDEVESSDFGVEQVTV